MTKKEGDSFSVRRENEVNRRRENEKDTEKEQMRKKNGKTVKEREREIPRSRSCLAIIDKAERFKNNEATRWK